jgi:hypothetical protein
MASDKTAPSGDQEGAFCGVTQIQHLLFSADYFKTSAVSGSERSILRRTLVA